MTTGQLGPAVDLRRQEPRPEQRWPSWVEIGGEGRRGLSGAERAEASRDPERLLLIRYSDLVLVRPSDEKAFFPLHFWDKLRVLDPGSGVRIDGGGRANLLFSDGCRIDALHEFELWFSAGKAESLELDLVWVSRAESPVGGARDARLAAGWLGAARVAGALLDRAEPPRCPLDAGRRRGPNRDPQLGARPLASAAGAPSRAGRAWSSEGAGSRAGAPRRAARGRRTAEPTRRRAGRALRAELREAAAEVASGGGHAGLLRRPRGDPRAGATLDVRTELQPSRLRWGGVEFQVPGGRSLRIDPIGGRPFAPEESRREESRRREPTEKPKPATPDAPKR